MLEPVPQAAIEGADYPTAASHAVSRLLPIAMGVPDQAMSVLVDALS